MFPRLSSPVQLEEEVRKTWEEKGVFAKSLEASEGRPAWVFYEGPPTANGTPHNGHVLTRVMKDVFPRYRTMRGYRVLRKAGWDTHGLPVEVEVEKELGVHGKEAVLNYGLEAFNRACVNNVFTYIHEWDELTRDIGFWVDLKDPYVTYHKPYVESVWWALARLFEKGLLYQGRKVVWWWPQGGTTLSAAEVGLGYKQVDDPAATVRFRDLDDPTVSYLAWTTTPWTLPSNVALAVNQDVDYAYCEDPDGGEVVLAAALAASYELVPKRIVKGRDLLGKRYTRLYDFGPLVEPGEQGIIVHGAHVTTKSGAGIVHTAPAYGEDDMLVARAQGLGMHQWVGTDGKFVPGTGFVEGIFCKAADAPILRDLKERGLLFKRETIRHDYPFCWRAGDDPLIQFARPAWFIRTTSVKEGALANNAAVNWHPEHIQEGRFGDFLRNNVDWALSRERFWGTPLNIWTCGACEHRVAPTSLNDLRARGASGLRTDVEENLQVHRPWIDGVTLPCPKCSGTMTRVTEVIDCWFDSGAMPFAQWGFPHQNVDKFRDQFPADFISEAIDQTRGWFYTLLMISTLVFDDETCAEFDMPPVGFPRPYKNCVVLGHVCDKNGLKESKSKGNYTSPNLVMTGVTWQDAVADASLTPGTMGIKKGAIESLDCGDSPITLSSERHGGTQIAFKAVAAKVERKDAVHLHPDDLERMGLDRTRGGRLWFHLPSDPPGADAFRWLFCHASPPWTNTRLSLRAIREGQREFLLRLRNVYQFFSIYADIAQTKGQFDPTGVAPRSPSDRTLLDRWILARLDATVRTVTENLDAYRLYEASRSLAEFVDDLSNWYVRRSRRRFWGEGVELEDSLWTLYEVLVTVSHLIAPFTPFHADGLYQALVVVPGRADAKLSVHLSSWPNPDDARVDRQLEADMALARDVASLGLSARTASKIKVRQPLQAITVVLADPTRATTLKPLEDLILDELNVREVRFAADAATFVNFTVKANFKSLGARLGPKMKPLAAKLSAMDPVEVKRALDAGTLAIEVDGESIPVTPADVEVRVDAKGGFEAASSPGAVVALHTQLDDDLRAEGFVRELTNRVQTVRKDEDLGYTERIALRLVTDAASADAINRFASWLTEETLCTELQIDATPLDLLALAPESVAIVAGDGVTWMARDWDVDGQVVHGFVRRA